MALREFEVEGLHWRVWDVRPKQSEFVERRRFITPVTVERRQRDLGRRLPDGWLAFECLETGERRRSMPVPPQWRLLPDDSLQALCAEATVAPRRRKHGGG